MSHAVPLPAPLAEERWVQAQRFMRDYHTATGRPGLLSRLRDIEAALEKSGHYDLSSDELHYGAKLAWRNSARCVGRAYWPALMLRDRRHVRAPDQVFAELRLHLQQAWNGGRIRPVISVFAPGVRIINDQLIRYAGYPDGLGDPQNAALTTTLLAHGWTPPRVPGPFDVLPLAIEEGGQIKLFSWLPEDVQEVALVHPQFPAFAELGLKWHALPVISDMVLEVGGLPFGCAPFSGWYLQTEIAARNLADPQRYHQLPRVAAALGLDTRRERSLWRDRALLELNVATLYSFDQRGVTLADHHRVSRHFVRFEAQEQRAGRRVQGRWSWLISPLSPATTPIWHRHYQEDEAQRPAFLKRSAGCPFH